MLKEKLEQTKLALRDALESEQLKPFQAIFPDPAERLREWSLEFWDRKAFPRAFASRLEQVNAQSTSEFAAFRFLLVRNSLYSLEQMETLAVDDEVKRLMCEEYQAFAKGDPEWLHLVNPQEYSFRALLGISICKRFRAGLLDWEDAGFPRSWLLRVPRKDILRTLWHLLTKMGGFKPFWFPHNAFLRGRVQFMREREWEQSILLMARSMKLNPDIKGILTGSWFYSPETHRVTPHLAWTTRIFVENEAFVTDIGPADPGSGFLQGAKDRQALYQAGKYKPTETILLWPRKNILQWLDKRPVKAVRAT